MDADAGRSGWNDQPRQREDLAAALLDGEALPQQFARCWCHLDSAGLTGRFHASDELTFTLTVQNLLDNKPKVVGNTIGSTSYNSGNVYPSTYDALGRRYTVAAKLRF